MYTIEFEADISNGMIKIPEKYKELNSKHIKVIAVIDAPDMANPLLKEHVEENPQFSDKYIEGIGVS
ncbi:hypothetical protein [Methyloprofundus sp.]|uniref:hypothetical protein n=1 Tax=Methyloprofundus sp. TaxID=2020875 RepID=UPI003D132DC3